MYYFYISAIPLSIVAKMALIEIHFYNTYIQYAGNDLLSQVYIRLGRVLCDVHHTLYIQYSLCPSGFNGIICVP